MQGAQPYQTLALYPTSQNGERRFFNSRIGSPEGLAPLKFRG